jgi:L-seryl-tRNA(Ser) seleniumtransferase
MPIVERLSGLLPGYCSLEIDLKTGKRGERTKVLEELLSLLTGCEAAIVVNNNAGAVMLAVSALSYGKEVIVSRGELIEIGGSFRLPDVIVSAGGVLKEVGTTNRTRADDYRKAVTPNTGILLRCHRSNFAITGFTEEAAMGDLVKLSKETGVPLLEDLGSGAIFDLSSLGLKAEPTVGSVIQAGVDLVLFSGDKLLGGVQAGIVAGKRELVERLRKHPIYRALRADKLIITILEGVLSQYLSPEPQTTVPLLAMASCPSESLRQRAENLCSRLLARVKVLRTQICPASSAFGGGTLPDQTIPSFGLEIHAPVSCEKLVEKLRAAEPPVVPIVSDGKVILDLRTILPEEEPLLMAALEQVDQELQSK